MVVLAPQRALALTAPPPLIHTNTPSLPASACHLSNTRDTITPTTTQTANSKCPLQNLMAGDARTGPVKVMVRVLSEAGTRENTCTKR